MTRKSRREIERAVEDLGESETVDDGDTLEFNVSAPFVEYDPEESDADVVANYQVVMRREDAEREGYEILGPADGRDGLVRVGEPE
jgi:hypothetical protein